MLSTIINLSPIRSKNFSNLPSQEIIRDLAPYNHQTLSSFFKETYEQHALTCHLHPKLRAKNCIHLHCAEMKVAKAIHEMLQLPHHPIFKLYKSLGHQDLSLDSLSHQKLLSIYHSLDSELNAITSSEISDESLKKLLIESLATKNYPLVLKLLSSERIQHYLQADSSYAFMLAEASLAHNQVEAFQLIHPHLDLLWEDMYSFTRLFCAAVPETAPEAFQTIKDLYPLNFDLFNQTLHGDQWSLVSMLVKAAQNNHEYVIKVLMEKIPMTGPKSLVAALQFAAQNGYIDVVKILSTSPRFASIPAVGPGSFATILNSAALCGHANIIHVLTSHPQFKLIPATGLWSFTVSLQLAAQGDHVHCIQALAPHLQFSDIPLATWVRLFYILMDRSKARKNLATFTSSAVFNFIPCETREQLLKEMISSTPTSTSKLTERDWKLIVASTLYPKPAFRTLNLRLALGTKISSFKF